MGHLAYRIMNNEERKALHEKYLKGELSPAELDEFLNALGEGDVQDMADVEETFERSTAKWQPSGNIADKILGQQKGGKIRRLYFFRVAAAMIGFAILFGGAFKGFQYFQEQSEIKHLLTLTVPVGQTKELTLADGSKVTLASGSVFKYPQTFKRNERRVYLSEGRAFFEVAHDTAKPFTVQSGTLATTALGTSFVVQNYSRYRFEKVSLYTGKVKVEDGVAQHEQVILHPGNAYTYNEKDNTGRRTDFMVTKDPMNAGILAFEQTPLTEVIYSLSSYYGANIDINTKQLGKDINFSGKFSNGGTLEEALNSLAFIYKFNFKQTSAHDYMITD